MAKGGVFIPTAVTNRRPWWKWNVITLLALMLFLIGIGYAINGQVGTLISACVSIVVWLIMPIFAFPAQRLARGFCWIFGRHSRIAAWSTAVVALGTMIVMFPYVRHFAATEFVWRTGGQIQYDGGAYIMNVIASQETFREISGETWRKRFCGPVLSVRLDPFNSPVPIWFLRSFPKLEYLASVSMEIDDMQYLRDFPMLEDLVITAPGNIDAGLIHLEELPNLTGLRLNGESAISDDGLRSIAQLPKLRSLWVASQTISDQGLLNLRDSKLERLVLESTQVSNEGILAIRRAIPGLETDPEPRPTSAAEVALIAKLEALGLGSFRWRLDDEGRIGDLDIQSYVEVNADGTMPHNRSTDHHLTNDEAAIFEQLPNLSRVVVSSRDFTDGGLAHLKTSSKLKELSVALCPINGEGLIYLPRPSRLEVIDLSQCPLNVENFRFLEGLDALTTLMLVDTSIGDAGLARLPDLPSLQFLLVQECQISDLRPVQI